VTTTLIVAAALAALVGFIALYNSVIKMRQMTRNAWADVDVYLKRRADLIPNLVTAVKAYASHESTLFEAISTARSTAMGVGSVAERGEAENRLAIQVGRALILAENYPELKSNTNFLNLQSQLSDTESKIASARQYYNACVRDLNIKIEAFPSSIAASVAGVKPAEFFEVTEYSEREAPSLQEQDLSLRDRIQGDSILPAEDQTATEQQTRSQ